MITVVDWTASSESERAAALRRPTQLVSEAVTADARRIIEEVRASGDVALRSLTARLDGVVLESFAVSADEIADAERSLSPALRNALDQAIANVMRFHRAQALAPLVVETAPGVRCERHVVPIRAVGLYVPAGSAPLPSTAVMLAVPAQIAGCPVRVLCTPPRRDGSADPAILFVARRCGIEQVLKLGGAQAIAAMAYGTPSVPKVDKVFGPGNAWVTAAKQLVAQDPAGAAIDLPAGPSEVLVIADDTARPEFVAADLLAQAEHSPDAQALLVTPSAELARRVRTQIEEQAARLARRSILELSLASSRIILVADLAAAFEVSNAYGPEHLIIEVEHGRNWLRSVTNAGSVFLGAWSPEPLGDYCSGTNHVLPTGGHTRAYSGLSLASFTKHITVQEVSAEGLRQLGPIARTLAVHEGLDAHANAVTLRLQALGVPS